MNLNLIIKTNKTARPGLLKLVGQSICFGPNGLLYKTSSLCAARRNPRSQSPIYCHGEEPQQEGAEKERFEERRSHVDRCLH